MIRVHRDGGRQLRIGHKGAAALAPENSLRAIERALEHGVDIVEIDVLCLQDGTLVLAHSDDLREVTHGGARGRVEGRTLEELRTYAPELATFDEALALIAEHSPTTGVQVDLKWTDYEAPIVEALRRHELVDRALVSSFFPQSLRAVGELEPGLRLGLSYPLDRSGLARRWALAPAALAVVLTMRRLLPRRIGPWLEQSGATVATLHYLVVSRAVVDRCHELGAAVWVWTVDRPWTLRRMVAAGVDGIITNDPRIFALT